jgi:hypothetical protein
VVASSTLAAVRAQARQVVGSLDSPDQYRVPLFAGSMQMTVYPVLAELTLTDWVALLAPYAPQGVASLAAAEAEIDRLLTELGLARSGTRGAQPESRPALVAN